MAVGRPKQLQNLPVSPLTIGSSLSALVVHTVDENGAPVTPGAGSTQVSIKDIRSTGGSSNVTVIDSTNNSIGVTIRAGSAAGTEYTDGDVDASISGQAILFDNSTNTLRPVSITRGLPVNLVQGQVVRSTNSVAADLLAQVSGTVRSTNSVAGDLLAQVSGTVRSTNSVAADLVATVRVNTSSGGAVEGSTAGAHGNLLGLNVRPVLPTLLSTTVLLTSTHSTAVYELVSSAAAVRHKVYAYSVGSTHTNPSTLIFFSSAAGGDHWHVPFGSGSSGMTGANLAVGPPAFLFGSVVSNALNVRIEGGSSVTATVVARVSFSYFSEA